MALSPQGYVLGGDPESTNPFWDGDSGTTAGDLPTPGEAGQVLALINDVAEGEEITTDDLEWVDQTGGTSDTTALESEVESLRTDLDDLADQVTEEINDLQSGKVDDVVLEQTEESTGLMASIFLTVKNSVTTTLGTLYTLTKSALESLLEDIESNAEAIAEVTSAVAPVVDGNGGSSGQVWGYVDENAGWSNITTTTSTFSAWGGTNGSTYTTNSSVSQQRRQCVIFDEQVLTYISDYELVVPYCVCAEPLPYFGDSDGIYYGITVPVQVRDRESEEVVYRTAANGAMVSVYNQAIPSDCYVVVLDSVLEDYGFSFTQLTSYDLTAYGVRVTSPTTISRLTGVSVTQSTDSTASVASLTVDDSDNVILYGKYEVIE